MDAAVGTFCWQVGGGVSRATARIRALQQSGAKSIPSERTVNRILERCGLIVPRRVHPRPPPAAGKPDVSADKPNALDCRLQRLVANRRPEALRAPHGPRPAQPLRSCGARLPLAATRGGGPAFRMHRDIAFEVSAANSEDEQRACDLWEADFTNCRPHDVHVDVRSWSKSTSPAPNADSRTPSTCPRACTLRDGGGRRTARGVPSRMLRVGSHLAHRLTACRNCG